MYPFLSLREYLWLYESRGWHFTVHHINVLFLFFNFFYFSTDLIRVAMTSKVRRLKHFHHSYKGLTWATAVSSSRTFLSSMSVLTMWCSTTWFGGSVTAPLFCTKEKILKKYKICVLRSLSALGFNLFYEHRCSWTLLLVQWSSAITCVNNDIFSIALNIFY